MTAPAGTDVRAVVAAGVTMGVVSVGADAVLRAAYTGDQPRVTPSDMVEIADRVLATLAAEGYEVVRQAAFRHNNHGAPDDN